MTRRIRAVALVATGALVLAAPALAAAPPKQVGTKINVKQGSIGALKLGIPASKAKSLLGKPDDQDKQGFSGKSYNLTLSYKRYGLSLTFWQGTQGGTPKLSGIKISSPQYSRTAPGSARRSRSCSRRSAGSSASRRGRPTASSPARVAT